MRDSSMVLSEVSPTLIYNKQIFKTLYKMY